MAFRAEASGGGRRTYFWDFGDGNAGSGRETVHTYEEAGRYTVILRVRRENGNRDEDVVVKDDLIEVIASADDLNADFDIEGDVGGCAPQTLRFVNRSRTEGDVSWNWDFGDGATSTERQPTHTYTDVGNFTVTLTVEGECASATARESFRLLEEPEAVGEVSYRDRVDVGAALNVRWTAVSEATAYLIEARRDGTADWEEYCDTDPDDLDCTLRIQEPGTWRVRVLAVGGCGVSEPTEGPLVEIVGEEPEPEPEPEPLPEVILLLPLDDCDVEDAAPALNGAEDDEPADREASSNGDAPGFSGSSSVDDTDRESIVVGPIDCTATDRFGDRDSAVEFLGSGSIVVESLPAVAEDFSVSFWTRLPSDSEGARTLLELAKEDGAAPLVISWSANEGTIRVAHGDLLLVVDAVLGDAWHHILITRETGVVRLYLDGAQVGSGASGASLGSTLSLGSGVDGDAPFIGTIDEVLYESFARDTVSVLDVLLLAGRSAYLEELPSPESTSVEPSEEVPALRFRLLSAPDETTRLRSLRIKVEDPSGDTEAALALVDRAVLRQDSGCTGSTQRTIELRIEDENGDFFLVPPESAGNLGDRLSEDGTCFTLVLEIEERAVLGAPTLQCVLRSPDDISIVADGGDGYVAGRRRLDEFLRGPLIRIVGVAPRALVSATATAETVILEASAESTELLSFGLNAGGSEGIRVRSLLFEAASGTRLDGVSNANVEWRSPEGVRRISGGVFDRNAGTVRFDLPDLALGVAELAEVRLDADIAIAEPEPTAATIVPPLPPGHGGASFAMVSLLLSLTLVAARFPRARRWQPLVAVTLLSCSVLSLAGCGPVVLGGAIGVAAGGGGGGGGGGGATTRVATGAIQLQLSTAGINAVGVETGAPVVVEADSSTDGGLVMGTRFEVR